MIFKIARITVALGLAALLCNSVGFAQTPAEPQKEQQKKNEKKPKNSDIDNIGNRNINKGSINFMSLEKEIALGRELAAEVERSVKLVEDPMINEYVNRVGQNLVRNSDAQVPFQIKVIESDEVNAFALPGGFFYVNSGLLLAADEEAELAGVMAHEIAHVTARHGSENNSKGQLMNIATIPLIFLGGPVGLATRQASNFLIPVTFYQFSQKSESEADYLGLQYLYKTGYDPTAAVSFFEKLQAKETAKPGTMSKLFSSHPPTGDRIERTKGNIEKVLPDREQYVVTTSEFNKIKAHLASLQARRPAEEESNKPSLRRRTTSTRDDSDKEDAKDAKTTDKDEKATDKKEEEKKETKDDDRPVLRRRP
jgi:beta-barrel assembly-enhancing protease